MKTILVPTDFSSTAKTATDVAASIATKAKAELILLHVVEEVDEGSFNVEGEVASSSSWEYKIFTDKLIKKSKKQLSIAEEELTRAGVTVRSLLRIGTPYHGINAIISESKVDLVVMGTNGRSPVEEILLGSNTEKVIRRSACPVLSVNKKPFELGFKSIVFAVSLDKDEVSFPAMVKEIQQIYGSKINLVRINTPGMFINDKVVKEKMEEFAQRFKLQNYTLNIYNDFNEESGIINFSESVGADLVAMLTHGRTGLAHLLNGSIAEGVSNHSRRPVLTVVMEKKSKKGK